MLMQLDKQKESKAQAYPTGNSKITISSNYLQAVKRSFVLGVNLISFSGCVIAIFQLYGSDIGSLEIGLLFFMYAITGVGISVGFHRHFTHNAFKTKPVIRTTLAILGSMAAIGPVISWVATHRCHHQHSDVFNDPHSPNLHGKRIQDRLRGLWHAHMGWLLDSNLPNSFIFAKDLLRDPAISTVNRLYLLWIFLGLAIPAILGGVLMWSWLGAFQGFLWGGLVRIFLGFHAACSINSVTHAFGRRPFDTPEQSRNNIWLTLPTFGEGWHNNHHAFPNSARFGLKWWHIDLGYLFISALKIFGLAWHVKIPSDERIEAKKAV